MSEWSWVFSSRGRWVEEVQAGFGAQVCGGGAEPHLEEDTPSLRREGAELEGEAGLFREEVECVQLLASVLSEKQEMSSFVL